jgi:hypothetical protein
MLRILKCSAKTKQSFVNFYSNLYTHLIDRTHCDEWLSAALKLLISEKKNAEKQRFAFARSAAVPQQEPKSKETKDTK